MSGFRALTLAQWRAFYRDKQTLFWTMLFPVIFLVIFGVIFGMDSPSKQKIVVAGDVPLLQHMPQEGRGAFDQLFEVQQGTGRDEALEQVRQGDLDALVEAGPDGAVVLRYSQTDPSRAARLVSVFESFVGRANVAASGQPPRYRLEGHQVEDTSLRPIQYTVPSLLGYAVCMGAVFGGAMSLVNWRNTRLLRRLRLAPTKVSALVGSRTLISLAVATIQVAIFLVLGMVCFGLKLTPSWYMVLPLAWCGTLAFLAIGLLVGAVSKTEEGASGLANLIVLPMAFLGGSFIRIDQAPAWMRSVSQMLPLGHLNRGMLDTMVRGEGPGAAIVPCLVLLAFAAVIGGVAARVFRWEAD